VRLPISWPSPRDSHKARFTESLRIARRIDDRIAQYYNLEGLGYQAAGTSQAQMAARLLGAAETLRTTIGTHLMMSNHPQMARAKESAIHALGAARFQAEYDAGTRMNREAALRLALGEAAASSIASADGQGTGLLGKREAQVARLLAEGLSNKEIGTRLFVSERTVDTHVRNILNKLGFNSRTQIAA